MAGRGEKRRTRRDEVLERWAGDTGVALEQLDDGQRWVVYAGVRAAESVASVRPMKRVLSFFLSRSEMDLSNKVVGAVIGVSDRAVQTTRHLEPKELVDVVAQSKHAHRQAKLAPHHAGPIARFLVEHPHCKVSALLAFIKDELEIEVTRHTLGRYLKRYGLGCLREIEVDDGPFFGDTPATGARSC